MFLVDTQNVIVHTPVSIIVIDQAHLKLLQHFSVQGEIIATHIKYMNLQYKY